MKSIKIRLVAMFTLLILIVSLGLGIASVHVVTKNLMRESHEDLQRLAEKEEQYIRARRDKEIYYMETMAQNEMILNKDIPWEEKVVYFEKEAKRVGYISFVFVDIKGQSIVFDQKATRADVSNRPYYQEAMEGKAIASDVVISKATGEPVVAYAAPIIKEGKMMGVFFGVKEVRTLSNIAREWTYGETGYSYIVNNKGITIAHKNIDFVLKQDNVIENEKEDSSFQELADLMRNKILKRKAGSGDYIYKGKDRIVGFAPVEGSPWIVVVAVETQDMLREVSHLKKLLGIFTVIAVIIGAVITYIVSEKITKPITLAVTHINEVANYDITKDVPLVFMNRKDEIGALARAIQKIEDNLRNIIGQIGNTTQNVASSAQELATMSQQTSDAADEIAKTIEEISNGANEQAKDTEQAVGDIIQLSRLIEEDEKKLNELNQSSNQVMHLKEEGVKNIQELVRKTNINQKASKEINGVIVNAHERAEKIYKVSQMIKKIADQTNLLALNAAIEAARAGDAGKGFSIVADEIRKLAEQSNQFAEEISSIINELKDKTENAVTTMEEMTTIVDKQTESVRATENRFEDIARAIEKSMNAIDALNESEKIMKDKKNNITSIIENLSAICEENAAGTEEVAASVEEQTASMEQIANASESLANLADNMEESIAKFKV